MGMVIKKRLGDGSKSNLYSTISNGQIYSQKDITNWSASFSPSIFETYKTKIIISEQVYQNYIELLNFSKTISEDGEVGVSELPFIWIGRKEVKNDEIIINITNNVLYPIRSLSDDNGRSDLDYKTIKEFLLKLQDEQNGVNLENIPALHYSNCSNDTTAGGIGCRGDVEDVIKNYPDYDNLVICAGHTHPKMTKNSSTDFQTSPRGTDPKSFGLGPRGYNLSSGDLNVWRTCVASPYFDNGVTFIGANICHNGDLNLLVYEGDDPKMARDISTEEGVEIQTSQFNRIARDNYLSYLPIVAYAQSDLD